MMDRPKLALSIRQPWATLTVQGAPVLRAVDNEDGKSQRVEYSGYCIFKDIENRKWRLPRKMLNERVCVHAAARWDNNALEWLLGSQLVSPAVALMLHSRSHIPTKAIIGEVTIIDCVTESDSPWFVGPYGFVLENPTPYERPIPCKGRLGFFNVSEV